MQDHTCCECGASFTHDICDHPERDGGELYCLQCSREGFSSWSPDETGMEDEEV